jgi:hypothetical protein
MAPQVFDLNMAFTRGAMRLLKVVNLDTESSWSDLGQNTLPAQLQQA